MKGGDSELHDEIEALRAESEKIRQWDKTLVARLQSYGLYMLEHGARAPALKILAAAGRITVRRELGIDLGEDDEEDKSSA